jgi:hypothetical protein
MAKNNHFSQVVSTFHGKHLPELEASLVGYSAILKYYNLQVPKPSVLAAIGKKHTKYQKNGWVIFSPRYIPDDTLYGHLIFALKHEGIELGILKALFDVISTDEILNLIQLEPTGAYSRRIWFLYEWLQEKILDLPDAKSGNFVDLLDPKLQYPGPIRNSKRHRVRNNLPGVPEFCPTIRRTAVLDEFINLQLEKRAEVQIGTVHSDLLSRAAAFLLLKDSKASYAIEGETPPQNRAERWAKAIAQAGQHSLSDQEILRLQDIVISDFRFTHYGYRVEGGFIGEHDRETGLPIPDHISARAQDLPILMDGLIATNDLLKDDENFNPVLAATLIAFGFVFIHPLEDGNGRIHRYLMHHVLAEKGFTPKGLIFPVSAVILKKIEQYRKVLESFSFPRLKFIEWRPTEKGNLEVTNETLNLYRYFDATEQSEFLFDCVRETIEKILPEEIKYLQNYDKMKIFINSYIDMPDRVVDLLIRFLTQNNGKFSKRALKNEFNSLTEVEVKTIETAYAEIFINAN